MAKEKHNYSEYRLLELLELGVEIKFPNGTWLKGDPGTKYIKVGTELSGYSGQWNLSQEGVNDALHDLDSMIQDEEDEA